MKAGFCILCKQHTPWVKQDGWLFHTVLRHQRCSSCHAAVGETALAALIELKRQFRLVAVDREIHLLRHAIALSAIAQSGHSIEWSEPSTPAPVLAPVPRPPTTPRIGRVRPGPGFRA
jgi:hypothetical protein